MPARLLVGLVMRRFNMPDSGMSRLRKPKATPGSLLISTRPFATSLFTSVPARYTLSAETNVYWHFSSARRALACRSTPQPVNRRPIPAISNSILMMQHAQHWGQTCFSTVRFIRRIVCNGKLVQKKIADLRPFFLYAYCAYRLQSAVHVPSSLVTPILSELAVIRIPVSPSPILTYTLSSPSSKRTPVMSGMPLPNIKEYELPTLVTVTFPSSSMIVSPPPLNDIVPSYVPINRSLSAGSVSLSHATINSNDTTTNVPIIFIVFITFSFCYT